MAEQPILVAESIGKSYHGRTVLESAFLRAFPGRVTALVGRNGSGKSTLLKIVAGLTRRAYGSVRYDGISYETPRLSHLAKRGLFFLSADMSFLSGGRPVGAYLAAIDQMVSSDRPSRQVLPSEINNLLGTRTGALSTGERRLVELILAERTSPKCLLADEPFRGLSPKGVETASTILRRLKEDGCALVITGHELADVLALADEVIWVASGTTRCLGSIREALDHWDFRRSFLGSNQSPHDSP